MQVGYSMHLLSENSHICMARSNILRTSITSTVDSLILRNLYFQILEGQLQEVSHLVFCCCFCFVLFLFVCLLLLVCFATGWLCVPRFSAKNKIRNDPRKSSDLKQKLMDKDSPQCQQKISNTIISPDDLWSAELKKNTSSV